MIFSIDAIDVDSYLCCGRNEEILRKTSNSSLCCGDVQYDSETQCCCNGEHLEIQNKTQSNCCKQCECVHRISSGVWLHALDIIIFFVDQVFLFCFQSIAKAYLNDPCDWHCCAEDSGATEEQLLRLLCTAWNRNLKSLISLGQPSTILIF